MLKLPTPQIEILPFLMTNKTKYLREKSSFASHAELFVIWTICPLTSHAEDNQSSNAEPLKSESVIPYWAIEIWTICHPMLRYWILNNLSLTFHAENNQSSHAEPLKSEQPTYPHWAIEIWTICHPMLNCWNINNLSSHGELLKSE